MPRSSSLESNDPSSFSIETDRRHSLGSLYRTATLTILLLLTLLFDFRLQIFGGFSHLLSSRFDGSIEISILEHWRNVLHGIEQWNKTRYFFPYKGTLAYNDGYLLYGVLYTIFRDSGLDPYISSEFVNITVKAIGFASFFLMTRRVFFVSFAWAAFGAILFSVNASILQHAVHAQLLMVGVAPLLAVFVRETLDSLLHGPGIRLFGWLIATGALLGVWLMTAFYIVWFTLYFGLFFMVALICLASSEQRHAAMRGLRSYWPQAIAALVFIVPLLLPFFTLYLPKARSTGMWDFSEPAYYVLSPVDIINVGRDNLVWGGVDRWLNGRLSPDLPPFSEHTVGFPPLLIIAFFLSVWLAWRKTGPRPALRPVLLQAIAIATLTTWLFTIKMGDFIPWHLIYEAIPGAKALRVVARYQIFLAVPVTVLVVSSLARAGLARPATILICGALLAEEITDCGPRLSIDRNQENALLQAVPVPPKECRAFFVSAPREEIEGSLSANATYSHNVDGMVLSELLHLPTINGFSTFKPPDWDFVDDDPPAYLKRVQTYAFRHQLQGLCALDLKKFQWSVTPFP